MFYQNRLLQLLTAVLTGSCTLGDGDHVCALRCASGGTIQRFEDFNVDPVWDARNNSAPVTPRLVRQDFGYSPTRFAQGATIGEIGGTITRSLVPAFYGMSLDPLTLEDPLTASGQFVIRSQQGSSGVIVGWFNDATMGWRPPNWMGFRLDDGRGVLVEYNTQTNQAGGNRLPGEPSLARGITYSWTFAYDPAGSRGAGSMRFALDGPGLEMPVVLNHTLDVGHKQAGANFNRFGLMNVQRFGGQMRVYFDDLTMNGQTTYFNSDPRWDGEGNHVQFYDTALPGANHFGFSPTHHAGGARDGEMGGRAWRTDETRPDLSGYYGDDIGHLSLENRLVASGKLTMTEGAPDSGMLFGWFNSEERGWPPQNFLGVVIEGPSRVGHYFRPYAATSTGAIRDAQDGPVLRPDQTSHDWSIEYDPTRNGLLVATLDGQRKIMTLPAGFKQAGASFDRFGIATLDFSGANVSVFFDDISYTAEFAVPEPPSDVLWNSAMVAAVVLFFGAKRRSTTAN